MELALVTASSSASNPEITATGPKISSPRIRAPAGRRQNRWLEEESVTGHGFAAGPDASPETHRLIDSPATRSRCLALISGPRFTPSASPGPTLMAATFSVSFAVNSSRTALCTRIRLAAVHASPPLRIFAANAPRRRRRCRRRRTR